MNPHLKASLTNWEPPLIRLRAEPRLAQASRGVYELLGSVTGVVKPTDAVAAFERILAHWGRKGTLAGSARRDVSQAPWWFLVHPDDRADDRRLAEAYGESAAASSLIARALLSALLVGYPKTWRSFPSWCRVVGETTGLHARLTRWNDLDRRYQMFSLKGPERWASYWAQVAPDEGKLESEFGLTGQLAESGFARAGVESVLDQICQKLSNGQMRTAEELRSLLSVAEQVKGGIKFGLRVPYAKALLGPFTNRTSPASDLRDAIVDRACGRISDPRVRPAEWQGLTQEKDVLLRLLADRSMEFFFNLLRETVDREDHWAERERFWDRYRRAGRIREAWVALGPDAKRLAGKRNPGMLQYCGLYEGSSDRSHSILVMSIGEAMAVEGSHNMRFRLWPAGSANSPRLYQKRYQKDAVGSLYAAPHDVIHNGAWQGRVSDLIERFA